MSVPYPVPPRRPERDWMTILQLILTGLAVVSLWTFALLMFFFGLGTALFAWGDPLPVLIITVASAASGLLILPSAYYAWMRLQNRPAWQPRLPHLYPALWILILPLLLLAGQWAGQITPLSWVVLPLLHVIAIGLPLVWLAYLAMRRIPLGSPQRLWGLFASGLVLGPVLIIAAEIGAVIGLLILAGTWIGNQPELIDELNRLAESLRFGVTEERALELLQPYLSDPRLILTVIVFSAFFVPVVEELLKPIGMWLMPIRRLTPASGFAAGALSGAAYALFESLVAAPGAQDWAYVVAVRAGSGILHIFASAFVGWGLVVAWKEARYLCMALAYLLSVAVHGLWNGVTFMGVFAPFVDDSTPWGLLVTRLAFAAPFVLAVLTIGGLVGLVWANRKLRQAGGFWAVPADDRSDNML